MIWLVKWGQIIVLHVRHALGNIFMTKRAKSQGEISRFKFLTITQTFDYNANLQQWLLFIPYKNFNDAPTIRVVHYMECDKEGIIAKLSLFSSHFFAAIAVVDAKTHYFSFCDGRDSHILRIQLLTTFLFVADMLIKSVLLKNCRQL